MLVLEDDPDMREALAEVLRDEGYEVFTAGRGREAVELAARHNFDLLVSDIRMEGMSGLDAIEAVQRQQPGVGSMIVSGWASEAETLRAVELNVGAYLKKPFQFDDFLRAVRTTLQRRPRPPDDWLDWSLGLLARALDGQALVAPAGCLPQAMDLARRWAGALGYDREGQSTAARLALLRAAEELPGFDIPTPGPGWLSGWPGSDEPLQWLGLAAWRAAREGELPPVALVRARMSETGSPEAWRAYDSVCHESGPAPIPPRSLLALGQTLLEAGDAAGARAAFEKALTDRPTQLQASAHLAWLDWRQGDTRSAVQWARQTYAEASRLGPLTAASLALESALLVHKAGLEEGKAWLEETARWSQRLQLRGHQAVCALALGIEAWTTQALEVLVDPLYWPESQLAARWLMSEMVALSPHPQLFPLLHLHSQRLIAHLKNHPAPREFLEALRPQAPPDLLAFLGASELTPAAGPMLRFTSFGPFEVQVGQSSLPETAWKTQKNKLLLAYLLRYPGQSVHEDQLLEDFWPDDLVRGKRNLYSALSYIRRALGEGPEAVVRQQERLSFNWDLPHWCDHELFQKAATRGLEMDPGEDSLFHLRRAALTYRAPFLEGCFYDWALRRRDELEQLFLKVLARICSQQCQRRHYTEALEYASRFVQLAPHLQEAHLWKMRAHLGLGQPEEVIRQFAHCEKALRQEFGIEPSTEVLEVLVRARHGLPEASEIH